MPAGLRVDEIENLALRYNKYLIYEEDKKLHETNFKDENFAQWKFDEGEIKR
ncbi:MAG: hypothetical protein IPN18_16055 [Ignavibacteriales bacterium]|nr:hypothetical protein [Ignavibacteriales bacterium]